MTGGLPKHGLSMHVRVELGSNEAIKQAIAGGLGVSVLSEGRRTEGLLAPLDVAGFPLMRKWYLAYPAGKHLSVAAEAFRDFLLEHAGEKVG